MKLDAQNTCRVGGRGALPSSFLMAIHDEETPPPLLTQE